MSRQRLSWDEKKVAEISKQADPYTMNQDHKNNPIQKYDIGGPSEFAETPDMKTPWTGEGRNEVGLPAPAERAAVQAARKLEDKALKCITIAQRVLPGASDDMIEKQATDFMYLPDRAIIATLQRQAELAEVLAKAQEDDEEEKAEEVEAAKCKKEETEADWKGTDNKPNPPAKEGVPANPAKDEEVEAAKKKEEKEEEVEAAKKKEEKKEEVEAAEKKEDKEEKKEEVEAAKKKEEKEEEVEVEASTDLLDQIFAESIPKTGAKKLSGIVKKASTDDISLESLWGTVPDVSKAFE